MACGMFVTVAGLLMAGRSPDVVVVPFTQPESPIDDSGTPGPTIEPFTGGIESVVPHARDTARRRGIPPFLTRPMASPATSGVGVGWG